MNFELWFEVVDSVDGPVVLYTLGELADEAVVADGYLVVMLRHGSHVHVYRLSLLLVLLQPSVSVVTHGDLHEPTLVLTVHAALCNQTLI